jgi:preprotein translocase subunit SecG
MSILLSLLTIVLIIVSLLLVLLVLAQPAKSDGGMGSALGGGMAESVLGGSHGTVTSKLTINMAIVFFVLSFLLYLGNVYQRGHANGGIQALPNVMVSPTHAASVPVAQPLAPISIQPTPVATGTAATAPTPAPAKP